MSRNIGVLSDRDLVDLITAGHVRGGQVQPASLDLPLGRRGYQIQASFLPRDRSVLDAVADVALEPLVIPETGYIIMPGTVLLVEIDADFALPKDIEVRANPKSSIGRLDMFVRLICDQSHGYDEIPTGYHGRVWAEIAPRSFPVRIRPGLALTQIRFRAGSRAVEIGDDVIPHLISTGEIRCDQTALISKGLCLRIHLDEPDGGLVGYRARRNSGVIDLTQIAAYDPRDFWEPVYARHGRVILEHDAFYILASHERIGLSPRYSAEMVAYDASLGELRVHQAGFVDCGFGHECKILPRAVLEVRSYGGPVLVEHGQTIARLTIERMLREPQQAYGQAIGSSYQSQGIKLAKYFRAP